MWPRLQSILDRAHRWLAPRLGYYEPLLEHAAMFGIIGLLALLVLTIHVLSGGKQTTTPLVIEIPLLIMVFGWPTVTMARHCRRQDRLLNRIRAAYAMAEAALNSNNRPESLRRLRTIRACEKRWRFGDGAIYRAAFYSYITAVNLCFASALFFMKQWQWMIDNWHRPIVFDEVVAHFQNMGYWLLAPLILILLYGLMPIKALHAQNVQSRRWAEFYGDRLASMLRAGRGVEVAPHHKMRGLPPEGASARELFGLGQHFTKGELRRAWVRLACELHPDRWSRSPSGVRQIKEEALKRVNIARDTLEPLAA